MEQRAVRVLHEDPRMRQEFHQPRGSADRQQALRVWADTVK
jgi:hypothetical protein